LPKAEPVPAAMRARFQELAQEARNTIDLVASAPAARFE
jgi:hypothetical protein